MTDKPMTATELKQREVESAKAWIDRMGKLIEPMVERVAKALEREETKLHDRPGSRTHGPRKGGVGRGLPGPADPCVYPAPA